MRVMSKTPRQSVVLAAAVSALWISSVAGAAEPDTENDPVEHHFNAGIDAKEAGEWQKAYEEFAAAWALRQEPGTAANLGQAELKVGKPREAAEHLSYYLHEARDAPAKDRNAVADLLRDARGKLGALRVRVAEPGAEVLVDDVVVGTAPLVEEVLVEPGRRTISARKQGFTFVSALVEVSPGGALRELRIELQRPEKTGVVAQRPADGPREPDTKWKPWVVGGGSLLTAMGLGVGIGMTVRANDLSRQAEERWNAIIEGMIASNQTGRVCGPTAPQERQRECGTTLDKRRDQDDAENAAKAGFVVGGVAAAATLTVLLWPTRQGQFASVMVLPVVGGGESGARLVGSF